MVFLFAEVGWEIGGVWEERSENSNKMTEHMRWWIRAGKVSTLYEMSVGMDADYV